MCSKYRIKNDCVDKFDIVGGNWRKPTLSMRFVLSITKGLGLKRNSGQRK
jgi:hypothetical protein